MGAMRSLNRRHCSFLHLGNVRRKIRGCSHAIKCPVCTSTSVLDRAIKCREGPRIGGRAGGGIEEGGRGLRRVGARGRARGGGVVGGGGAGAGPAPTSPGVVPSTMAGG